jgi:F-type H+-transporting ATPase subunit b
VPVVVVDAVGPQPVARVVFRQEGGGQTTATTTAAKPPNPILPVGKEMAWGFGSFLVLFVLMRLLLFPKVKRGMDARYAHVQGNLEAAEAARSAAHDEVLRYQAAIAEARATANGLIEAARADVEGDRAQKLAAANARIAERRAAAAQEMEAAKQAALSHIEEAVVEVAASMAERVLGRPVDRSAALPVVAEVVNAAVPG